MLNYTKVYDLSQPWFPGMPHFPTHPPFLFGLTKLHGEVVNQNGGSSAADAIAMGSHVGTHIDALNHFSCGGKLHGGQDVHQVQSWTSGVRSLSVDTLPPIVRRGVLLDCGVLDADHEISPEDLGRAASGLVIQAGDIVLLRTAWSRYFREPGKYVNGVHAPGPGLAAARWLSARGIFAAGSDTLTFEKVPDPNMPVHVHLLVESGIHIIEVLNLEPLIADGVREVTFVAAPLRIEGATGAPMRPLAFV